MCLIGEEPSWSHTQVLLERHKFAKLIRGVKVDAIRPVQLKSASEYVWVEGVDRLAVLSPVRAPVACVLRGFNRATWHPCRARRLTPSRVVCRRRRAV